MTTTKDGGPAFPTQYGKGMTIRDWFAGQALAGIIADGEVFGGKEVARASFEYADAMLKAREGK